MTIRTFQGLQPSAKADVVDLWGEQVAEYTVPGFIVKCFHLYDFYVEVFIAIQDKSCRRYRACFQRQAHATENH